MVIFYHIVYREGLGADRWIYDGWRSAFVDFGHMVQPVTDIKDIKISLKEKIPDILMTSYSLWNLKNKKEIEVLHYLRVNGCKVAMFVDNDFMSNSEAVYLAKTGELADLFFGERSLEKMRGFVQITKRPYRLIANAADRGLHFPVAPAENYKCDIAFVGAYLPKKKEQFKRLLFPLFKKYRVRIFGPYWTWKDLFLLTAHKAFRKLKFSLPAGVINSWRTTLSVENERILYASAKICLNIHEREDGKDYDLLNQRTFKIPACGGFEICDRVSSLCDFFTADEVVMPTDDLDWFSKIDFYLQNEKERLAIKTKGTIRALRDHTYHNRVETLFSLLNI